MTNQATDAQETINQAALLPCRTCGGKKSLPIQPLVSGETGSVYCPDCREYNPETGQCDGEPTGREFPSLSLRCGFCDEGQLRITINGKFLEFRTCEVCQGTGRIPAPYDADRWDAAAEKAGYDCQNIYRTASKIGHVYRNNEGRMKFGSGESRRAARTEALAAVAAALLTTD